jgi:hypothetical protein
MAAQLKIDTTTSPKSLKFMSGTDYDYTTYQILTVFAATDTGVGTVSVNPASTTGLTSIGTFADTYYNVGVPGDHPVGTTLTTSNFAFYQDLQTATETLTIPIEYNSGLKEQVDANLNADSIAVALANLVANGVGSYALATTAPIGGTWTSKATIYNYTYTGASNVTYLWRKTAGSSTPTSPRPLKIDTTTSPKSIKEMSDAEIQTLTARFRNRIVASGLGKYALQTSAPVSGGTWATQGAAFSDTRNTESSVNYTGYYSGTYSGSYTGSFTGAYTGYYSGTFTGYYTGYYQGLRAYAGAYAGYYTTYYGGHPYAYLGYYTGYYTGLAYYAGAYAGYYTTYYAGYATGYLGYYTGYYQPFFSGAYTGYYSGTFTGYYSGTYTSSFSGSYSGTYTGTYAGITLNAATETVSTASLWIRIT